MANIEQYHQIVQTVRNKGAQLVAVSKLQPPDAIMELYGQGQRVFGENRVQELLPKQEALPKDIQWHLIGHLQRNKVKYIAPFVALIHSVDSLELWQEIDKQAQKCGRQIPCLLQFHIAQEETKFGLSLPEAIDLLQHPAVATLQHSPIVGVMGMASQTTETRQIETEFKALKHIFEQLKQRFFATNADFTTLSMGMSGDYEIALQAGSTMIRVGSKLFHS